MHIRKTDILMPVQLYFFSSGRFVTQGQ